MILIKKNFFNPNKILIKEIPNIYLIKKFYISSGNFYDNLLKINKDKFIFGISKRTQKLDQFNDFIFDISFMNFNKEIIERKSIKYKLLDFENNLYISNAERSKLTFNLNNKYLYRISNKLGINCKNHIEKKIENNTNYQDEFELKKIKEIFKNIFNHEKILINKEEIKGEINKKLKLIVIDDTINQKSINFINTFSIENKIPLLLTNTFNTKINMSKYYFPISLTPQMNIEYDLENILITYNPENKNNILTLSKVSSLKITGIKNAFHAIRVFFIILKNECFIEKSLNNSKKMNEFFIEKKEKVEEFYKLIKFEFDYLFKNNYLSEKSIIDFFNRLNLILIKYDFKFTDDQILKIADKIQLNKYMFPEVRFGIDEKKFFLDFLEINLNYQSYLKAKSKDKTFPKNITINYILYILQSFFHSLTSVLNYNIYACLKELEEFKKMPLLINFYGDLFKLNLLKEEANLITKNFGVKFVNFYNCNNEEKDEEFYQIKNSFYGHSYILDRIKDFPDKKVLFN